MQQKEEFPKQSRLLVFDDQLLHKEGGSYFGTDPRILFLSGLKDHFKSVHLFCKVKEVSDKHINEAFILPKDVKVHDIYYPVHFLASFLEYVFYLPKLIRLIKYHTAKGDQLCLAWPHPVSFLIWLASMRWKRRPGIIFLSRENAYSRMAFRQHGNKGSTRRKLLARMESVLARKGENELILGVGKKIFEKYSHTHPGARLLYLPRISETDVQNTKATKKEDSIRLLYVCDHTDIGLDSLILAVDSMLKIGVPASLDIVGKCKDLFGLQQMVIKQNLSDNIRFYPEVSHTNGLYKHYREADLLAVPYIKDAIPKSVFEAMSFGLPVIAPQSQNTADILTHAENAWLFKQGDSCGMADGVYYLHKNRNIRDELSENFGAMGKVYTLEYQQKQFVNYIIEHKENIEREDSMQKKGTVIPMGAGQKDAVGLHGMRKHMQWLMRIF